MVYPRLVFFTPEMIITNKRWRKMIAGDVYNERLKAFVVDEAHCVKKWYVKWLILYLQVHSVKHLYRSNNKVNIIEYSHMYIIHNFFTWLFTGEKAFDKF